MQSNQPNQVQLLDAVSSSHSSPFFCFGSDSGQMCSFQAAIPASRALFPAMRAMSGARLRVRVFESISFLLIQTIRWYTETEHSTSTYTSLPPSPTTSPTTANAPVSPPQQFQQHPHPMIRQYPGQNSFLGAAPRQQPVVSDQPVRRY